MKRRVLSFALGFVLLVGACTGEPPRPIATGTRSSSPTSPAITPPPRSPATVDPLCRPTPRETPGPEKGGSLPSAIAKIARQVVQERGLSFKRPVAPEPVSRREMARQIADSYQRNYPRDQAAAEGRALITIGAIPPGTDLYKAVVGYASSQVIGYYNTETHRLVFISDRSSSPLARFTLSHELTHALQDQNFGLGRLDRLNRTCRADRAEAFLSLIEGDAVVSQLQWARLNLSSDEIARLQREASSFPPPPASVPQFVREEFGFPYDAGQRFVQSIMARGGLRPVDDALRNPPTSTEQVLHPEKYPKDRPQDVVVPDISARLGKGWKAIDYADVGEGFLLDMLQIDVPSTDARRAAAGWDGGQYRAFGKGRRTGVVLMTVWDSERDAREFADTMTRFVGTRPAKVIRTGTSVRVLFGSDEATLHLLQAVAG